MDANEAAEFVRSNHQGVLVTRRKDGSVQTSPVVASVDGAGRLVVSSRETAFKVKHLLRDPRVTYCGFRDGFYGPWIQVDGTAEIVHLPEAMELLVDYYRDVSGEHPDWDDYRAAMERDQRVIIRFAIDRAGPNAFG